MRKGGENRLHYYKFNIGDYRRDTAHLNMVEHYIYRELIDWYYLDEKLIPLETQSVMRRLRLGSENKADLLNILNDFFVETKEGWKQRRIEKDIETYHNSCEVNKANGAKGGRPKKASTKRKKTQPVTSGNPKKPNRNPTVTLTNNHKPITNNQIKEKDKKEKIDDFMPNEASMKAIKDKYPGIEATHNLSTLIDDFKDQAHNRSKPFKDLQAGFRNYLRKGFIAVTHQTQSKNAGLQVLKDAAMGIDRNMTTAEVMEGRFLG